MRARFLLLISIAAWLTGSTAALAQSTPAELAEAGWKALEKMDGDRAATVFRQALALTPRDPVLHYGAGAAAYLLGREHEATQSLQRALDLEPGLVPASLLLGEIAYRAGNLDLAIRTYETTARRVPGNQEIRGRLESWRKEAELHHGFEERRHDRFTIAFEGRPEEPLAARATAVLEKAFWRIGQALGAYPSNPVTVILYTEQQFVDITRAPAWSGGIFDGRIRVPVRGASQNLALFDRVLTHELTHAMIKGLAPRGIPTWIHEGLAQHFEGTDLVPAARRLRVSGLAPLAALRGTFASLTSRQAVVAYDESLLAVQTLIQRPGMSFAVLLQDLSEGQAFEQAIERFGVTDTEFQAGLRRRLAAAPR